MVKDKGARGVRLLKLLFILLFVLLSVAFTLMNDGNVRLNYYFGIRELPIAVVILGAVALGILLGLLAALGSITRLRRENAAQRREIRSHTRDNDYL
jgi:putative membrane protein